MSEGQTPPSQWRITLWIAVATVAALLGSFALVKWGLEPHVTLHGRRLTWVDWSSLAGVALTFAAIVLAVDQAARARSASQQAALAVSAALGELAKSDLIIDLSALRQIEFDIDSAVENKDREAIRRLLRDLRDTGARAIATLKRDDATDTLIQAIEDSREAAWKVKIALTGAPKNLNLKTATEDFRTQIAPLTNAIAARVNELRLDVQRREEDDESIG